MYLIPPEFVFHSCLTKLKSNLKANSKLTVPSAGNRINPLPLYCFFLSYQFGID